MSVSCHIKKISHFSRSIFTFCWNRHFFSTLRSSILWGCLFFGALFHWLQSEAGKLASVFNGRFAKWGWTFRPQPINHGDFQSLQKPVLIKVDLNDSLRIPSLLSFECPSIRNRCQFSKPAFYTIHRLFVLLIFFFFIIYFSSIWVQSSERGV